VGSFSHTFLHSQEYEYDSWTSFLAYTFASPCLGCKLKARVATTIISQPMEGSERFDNKQDEPINPIVD